MGLRFSKYHGIGNDFVVVDGVAATRVDSELAKRICDRHLGVGADGVLLVTHKASGPQMAIINADGSSSEMCGNGIRCVALHLALHGEYGDRITIDTAAGPHLCRVKRDGGVARVEVEMAVPNLAPETLPMDAEGPQLDAALDVDGVTLRITAVSMGNPHAVSFDSLGDRRLTLGPALSKHKRFARGVNAGFARVDGEQAIALDVFERGVGWTRACGTGACAAAVAAVETGRMPRGKPIQVLLPGGPLTIVVGAPGERVQMAGPAELVFEGELTLHELEDEPTN
jgi:diaminopimelate epimerase